MNTWHEHDDEDDDDDEWDAAAAGDDDGSGDRLSAAELPDPSDTDDGTGTDDGTDAGIMPCPFCRRPVYEFADVCPACRNFIGGSDDPTAHQPPWRRRPAWFLLGLVLCVAILLGFVVSLTRMW